MGSHIGVTAHYLFLSQGSPPTLEKLLDHIEHIVGLIGIDHVGLGTDFIEGFIEQRQDPPANTVWRLRGPDVLGTVDEVRYAGYPEGLETVSRLPNLTKGLARRGYSAEEIEKILGGNFLRLFAQVCG